MASSAEDEDSIDNLQESKISKKRKFSEFFGKGHRVSESTFQPPEKKRNTQRDEHFCLKCQYHLFFYWLVIGELLRWKRICK